MPNIQNGPHQYNSEVYRGIICRAINPEASFFSTTTNLRPLVKSPGKRAWLLSASRTWPRFIGSRRFFTPLIPATISPSNRAHTHTHTRLPNSIVFQTAAERPSQRELCRKSILWSHPIRPARANFLLCICIQAAYSNSYSSPA